MTPRAHSRTHAGMTLLEVMIALGILFGSLGLYLHSVAQSRQAVDDARLITMATNLARMKMVDLEAKVREDGFGLNDDVEEEGDFSDWDYNDRWKWKALIEKVELPPAQELGQAAQGGAGGLGGEGPSATPPSPTGGAGGMGAMALFGQIDMIKNVLEQSIRKVTLEVEYPRRGRGHAKLVVVAYFTDPKSVDSAIQVPANVPPP